MRRADHPVLTDPPVLAGALWALVAHAVARHRLRRAGLGARIPAPPPLPARAGRGVAAMLARRQATCLERSLVLRRWLVAHGSDADVLIGVATGREGRARPGETPELHAWIDGVDDDAGAHLVLHRIPSPRRAGAR